LVTFIILPLRGVSSVLLDAPDVILSKHHNV